MTLADKYQNIKDQIAKAHNVRQDYNEASKLRGLADTLAMLDQKVSEAFVSFQLFRRECKLKAIPVPSSAKILIARLSSRFATTPSWQSIMRGNDWTRLLQEIDSFVDKARDVESKAWKEFCEEAFLSLTPPSELRNIIARTDRNQSLLTIYEVRYRDFSSFSKQLPTTSGDFAKINELCKDLKGTYDQLDQNVPEEVKRFLDRVNLDGAPLELLTPTVQNWLIEQGTISSYKIIRRSGTAE